MNLPLVVFDTNRFYCKLFFLENLCRFMPAILSLFHFIRIWVFLFHNLQMKKMQEFLCYLCDFDFLNLLYQFDGYDLMCRFLKKKSYQHEYHHSHFQNKASPSYDHLSSKLMATGSRFFIQLKLGFYYYRLSLIFRLILQEKLIFCHIQLNLQELNL